MFSTIRKIISLVTLLTALIVAAQQLKQAIDSFKKHNKETAA